MGRGGWWRNRFQSSTSREGDVPTVRVHGWNVPSDRLRGWLFTRAALRAAERYRERWGEPSILHAHSALWAGVAARRISRSWGTPYLLSEHSSAFARGLLDSWQIEEVRKACREADGVTAVSSPLAEQVSEAIGAGRINVVPNMVDTELFRRPPEGRGASPFRFLTVATLRPNKRVDLLIEAFARAFPDEDTRLTVVGDGQALEDLKELARRFDVAKRVEFPGRLSRQEVRRAMWESNVYVLSSDVETFGIALAEAMATGLPAVATRSGGPQEVVDEDTAWLVEPGDSEQMAAALEAARREEPDLRERAGEIRGRIVARYGEEAVVSRLRRLYRSVLDSAAGES